MDKLLAILKSEQIMGTVLTVALVIANDKLKFGLSKDSLIFIVATVGALILGESHKDAMAARATALIPQVKAVEAIVTPPKPT